LILQSFSLESLQELKAAAPQVPRVYLVDEEMEEKAGGFDGLVKDAKKVAHALGPSGYMAWPWKTRLAHDEGLFVHHYTINTPFQLALMNAFGSDGVFTDRSELVRGDLGLAVGDPRALLKEIVARPPVPAKEKPLTPVAPASRDGGPDSMQDVIRSDGGP
jgi:hypothetical protein